MTMVVLCERTAAEPCGSGHGSTITLILISKLKAGFITLCDVYILSPARPMLCKSVALTHHNVQNTHDTQPNAHFLKHTHTHARTHFLKTVLLHCKRYMNVQYNFCLCSSTFLGFESAHSI